MKKVAMLSWNCLYGDTDGQPDGIYVSKLASALVENGRQVHLFTRNKEDQPPHETIDGVDYHRINIDSSLPLLESISKFGTRVCERLKKVESQGGVFDVIHCNDWQPARVLKSLKLVLPRKMVASLHAHNKINELIKVDDSGPQLEVMARELMEKSHRLICVDQNFKAEIMNKFSLPEQKVIVVPEAFHWEDFQGVKDQGEIKKRYGIGPMDPVVLFVGAFDNTYAPDVLVDAIPALLKNHPHLRFILVGDGELMWPIRIKARYMNFEHAVSLVGHKEGAELHELFQAADIVTIPNKADVGPYQMLAAWSAKKPVVATKAGSCGLLRHEENGILIYDNPGSMVWGVEKILFGWDNAHSMAQRGWEYIKGNYTWDAIARKMNEIYHMNGLEGM